MWLQFPPVVLCCSLLGQVPTIDATAMAKPVQEKTILATVRLVNSQQKCTGCGVVLAPQSGPVAYVLTAAHLVQEGETVDVEIFSNKSYPKPQNVYKAVAVIARRAGDNQDLALLRITRYGGETAGLKVCSMKNVPADRSFTAFAAGCADASPPTLASISIQGTVLAAQPGKPRPARFWQSAEEPGLGASGGPLVNSQGELLGICSGTQARKGFYCHLEDVHALLKDAGLVVRGTD